MSGRASSDLTPRKYSSGRVSITTLRILQGVGHLVGVDREPVRRGVKVVVVPLQAADAFSSGRFSARPAGRITFQNAPVPVPDAPGPSRRAWRRGVRPSPETRTTVSPGSMPISPRCSASISAGSSIDDTPPTTPRRLSGSTRTEPRMWPLLKTGCWRTSRILTDADSKRLRQPLG